MLLSRLRRRGVAQLAPLLLSVALVGCDVAIQKRDSVDPVNIGQELTYTINVTSEPIESTPEQRRQLRDKRGTTPQAGSDVIVTDTLPAGVTVKSISTTDGSCSQSGNTITCNLGSLSGTWASVITVTVIVNPDAASEICNTAEVDSQDDFTNNNNLARECTTVLKPSVTVTPTAVATPEDKDNKRKLTELQKLNNEKTFTGGFSDVATEGVIVGYRNGPDSSLVLAPNVQLPEPAQFDINDPNPFILIANIDGIVMVRLFGDARDLINQIRLGYYLGAEGEKQNEHLFDAYDGDQKRK